MSKSIRDGIGYWVKEEYVLQQNQTLQKNYWYTYAKQLICECQQNYGHCKQ